MPSQKSFCLTIEVQNRAADCGYSVCFTVKKELDYTTSKFDAWRDEVTNAVFKTNSAPFTTDRKDVLELLVAEFEDINGRYPDYQIKSQGGVPAIQIETVDGKRLDVEMQGSFDADTDVTFSRKTLAVPRKVNGHGTGGIRAAEKKPFEFMGVITAGPARITPKRPKLG